MLPEIWRVRKMKVRRNSEQKNVLIDESMYTEYEIKDLLYKGIAFFIKEDGTTSSDENEYIPKYDRARLSLSQVKNLEVIYVDFLGYYTNVAILINGDKIFVSL
jgi:hypothetical protein